MKKWWFPIGGFAGRTFVSFAIYVLIALPALAVFAFVEWVERLGASVFLVQMFRLLEYAVVVVDVVFFLVYVASDLRSFIRERWK